MAEPRDATNTLNRQPSDTRGAHKKGSSITPRAGTHVRVRSRRISQVSEPSTPTTSTSKENGRAGPSSSTAFPTTPESPTPVRVPRTPRTASEPGLRSVSEKSVLETPVNTKGKRKAEEVDLTPPDQRAGHHAKFVLPEGGHRECFRLQVGTELNVAQVPTMSPKFLAPLPLTRVANVPGCPRPPPPPVLLNLDQHLCRDTPPTPGPVAPPFQRPFIVPVPKARPCVQVLAPSL